MTSFIGIDLGTTNSCVAVYRGEGKIDVLVNQLGDRLTPSCVCFAEREQKFIGKAAKTRMLRPQYMKNTVYGIKRIIGRPYSDPVVEKDSGMWPFDVIDDAGTPKIRTVVDDVEKTRLPEEISAIVLHEMKTIAEKKMREDVDCAVITIPAYFNNSQRQATIDAAKIVGFKQTQLLHEPTAAAIAYGLEWKFQLKQNVLVYDLGGGTFDVTVLSIEKGIFNVIAVDGDTHLGGDDFNERLYHHFVTRFNTDNDFDMRKNDRARLRLLLECEKAKMELSTSMSDSMVLDSLFDGVDFEYDITRAEFERLNKDYFSRTLKTVERVLRDANMPKNEIDYVVLVGGSTRIPYIQQMLEKYFGQEKIRNNINPDEAVAYGAAVHSAYLSGAQIVGMVDFDLRDVTPLSLGIKRRSGRMGVVVKRNTKIPTKQMRTFYNAKDNQTAASLLVFEGEGQMADENSFLGKFVLNDIPPMPVGKASLDVWFNLNPSGILHVSAKQPISGSYNEINITMEKGKLTYEEVKKRIQEHQNDVAESAKWKQTEEALYDLETYADEVKESTCSDEVRRKCDEIHDWIKRNKWAPLQDIEALKNSLQSIVWKIRGQLVDVEADMEKMKLTD